MMCQCHIKVSGDQVEGNVMGGAHEVLVGKPDGNRPLERTRRRWEDDIEVDLKISLGRAWTGLIWLLTGHVARCCSDGNETWGSVQCGEFLHQTSNCAVQEGL